jgi:hypothetical protein
VIRRRTIGVGFVIGIVRNAREVDGRIVILLETGLNRRFALRFWAGHVDLLGLPDQLPTEFQRAGSNLLFLQRQIAESARTGLRERFGGIPARGDHAGVTTRGGLVLRKDD